MVGLGHELNMGRNWPDSGVWTGIQREEAFGRKSNQPSLALLTADERETKERKPAGRILVGSRRVSPKAGLLPAPPPPAPVVPLSSRAISIAVSFLHKRQRRLRGRLASRHHFSIRSGLAQSITMEGEDASTSFLTACWAASFLSFHWVTVTPPEPWCLLAAGNTSGHQKQPL